jgi:hypothetical protein
MLLNVLLSRLSLYIDESIGDHQCGFRRNRSTTDQIFCICQILERKWEYNETVHQLFIDMYRHIYRIYKTIILSVVLYGCESKGGT